MIQCSKSDPKKTTDWFLSFAGVALTTAWVNPLLRPVSVSNASRMNIVPSFGPLSCVISSTNFLIVALSATKRLIDCNEDNKDLMYKVEAVPRRCSYFGKSAKEMI